MEEVSSSVSLRYETGRANWTIDCWRSCLILEGSALHFRSLHLVCIVVVTCLRGPGTVTTFWVVNCGECFGQWVVSQCFHMCSYAVALRASVLLLFAAAAFFAVCACCAEGLAGCADSCAGAGPSDPVTSGQMTDVNIFWTSVRVVELHNLVFFLNLFFIWFHYTLHDGHRILGRYYSEVVDVSVIAGPATFVRFHLLMVL